MMLEDESVGDDPQVVVGVVVLGEGARPAEDGSCVGRVDGDEEGGVGETAVKLNLHFLYRIYNRNVSWL